MIRLTHLAAALVAAGALTATAGPDGTSAPATGTTFGKPVRLMAEGAPVQVEAPGYASPCWYDIDGDGKKDLIVGQFRGGHMRIYKNLGKGKLAAGQWLQAAGQKATVPGVW